MNLVLLSLTALSSWRHWIATNGAHYRGANLRSANLMLSASVKNIFTRVPSNPAPLRWLLYRKRAFGK